jgi:phage shock protein A
MKDEVKKMNVLQRVVTLIRANVNDMIDQAEDPEKMIKQLVTDLNNQLIQIKTTVAQSLADQYMMERRLKQAEAEVCESREQAEIAVDRGNDTLARAALQRQNSWQRTLDETTRQLEEQRRETDALKLALQQLELKIAEVNREREVLLARHRRATAKEKIVKAKSQVSPERIEQLLDAITGYVDKAETSAMAHSELDRESDRRRLTALKDETKLDEQLNALKASRQPHLPAV